MLKQSTCLAMAGLFVLCSIASAQPIVKINEVSTGTPDFIELHNCAAGTVDVSGWTVATWYATLAGVAPTAETPFVLPAGTLIPAGGYLILEENGTAGSPGTLPNSIAVGFNYFWVAGRTLEVALIDAGGAGVDYLYRDFYGNGTTPNLPAPTLWTGSLTSGTGDTVERIIDTDTDDASDWNTTTAAPTTAAPNVGQLGGICSATPLFQVNTPEAHTDFGGVQTTGYGPAVKNISTCQTSNLTITTALVSTAFEVVVSQSPVVPFGDPGTFQLPASGQMVNVSLFDPSTFFLNGAAGPIFQPFPGTLNFGIAFPVALTYSLQAVFVDPANPNGVALSQASQITSMMPQAVVGPTTLDGTVLVDLTTLCGSVNFGPNTYTQVGVNANGRLSFGGVDSDFTSSVAEATTDLPFLGYWCDFDVSSGGSIDIIDNGVQFSVTWVNVPYYTEPAAANNFSITVDRASGDLILGGLTGIVMNPATALSTSDSIFLGLSPGSGASTGVATDPFGSLPFSVGGAGVGSTGDEMFYDFFDYSVSATVGVPFVPTSLIPGTLNAIHFYDAGGGTMGWYGI